MRLFIPDRQTTELEMELERCEAANSAVKEEKIDNESNEIPKEEMTEEVKEEIVEEVKDITEEEANEIKEETDEMKKEVDEITEVVDEVKEETPVNTQPSSPVPATDELKREEKSIKKKEKRCGEYLWILLTRLILSHTLSFDLKVCFFFSIHW